ncbi:MAG TPA: alkaline phosphatase family protein [Roseiflexaceae bacterium]
MIHLRPPRLSVVAAGIALLLIVPARALAEPGVPPEPKTPIKHFVVLMQAGHSFDNYFGTYPDADGIPPDTCVPIDPSATAKSSCIKPFAIADRSIESMNHSAAIFQSQYNNGQMNGFISALQRRNQDGIVAMGYYDDSNLPYYWNIADEYVLFDRFFSSASGGDLWNRMFWVSASPGNDESRVPAAGYGELPTIFDSLEQRGISWKFYVQNYNPQMTYRSLQAGDKLSPQVVRAPLLAFPRFVDDPKLSSHIVDLDQYFEDLRNGALPAVAYVASASANEHPPSEPEAGQRFVRGMINALMQSDAWNSSAFLITYDSWGGWYDHVPPPQVDRYGYGFRVPALLISPYARRGQIDNTQLDFTSILKFIEQNYGLAPLATRDAQANSLIGAFDFALAPRRPRFISFDRGTTTLAEPRRDLIYLCYSGAIVLAGLLLAGVTVAAGAGRLRPAPPLPRTTQDGAP